jgi:glycosyltransferase involved in cell wall biosynthesis
MKPKLLYIYPARSTFVAKDVSIFSEKFEVIERSFAPRRKWHLPFWLLMDVFRSFFNVLSVSRVVVQFGGYHALMPVFWAKLLRRPSAIVLGGYDAVALPEIGYGAFANKWMKHAVTFAYKNTSVLIPVHQSLMLSSSNYQNKITKQGILQFIPELKTKACTVPNGYDASLWPLNTHTTRDIFAITVASGLQEERRKILKGIDLFIEAAKAFPNEQFIIIGGTLDNVPPNVKCLNQVPNTELADYFNRAKTYLQLSLSEGFPNALCEAMLCGCIPVVSDVASMPEIALNIGFVLKEKSIERLADILKDIPSVHSVNQMIACRNRIEEEYSFSRRKKELLDIIEAM